MMRGGREEEEEEEEEEEGEGGRWKSRPRGCKVEQVEPGSSSSIFSHACDPNTDDTFKIVGLVP
eukprot:547848-Hanusia_phi.AAC.1